jgi:hypothetical protein
VLHGADAVPVTHAGITSFFDNIQLIPASSGIDYYSAQKDKAHFPRIQKELNVPYKEMLFFDDEDGNITKACLDTPFGILLHKSIWCVSSLRVLCSTHQLHVDCAECIWTFLLRRPY